MAYKLFCAAFVFLLIVEYSVAQESTCDPKAAEDLETQAKMSIFYSDDGEIRLSERYRSLYLKFESLSLELQSKGEIELDLLEKAFKAKMQIINQSRDVSNIIEDQRNKLRVYIKARQEVLKKYGRPNPNNFQLPSIDYFNLQYYVANCWPCNNISVFSSCLKEKARPYVESYEKRLASFKQVEKDLTQFDLVNSWEFLNISTNELMEIYKSYNQGITEQQVKDYYRNKLIALNEQIVEAQENPENSIKTYITFAGYITRKSLENVKYSVGNYEKDECEALKELDKILESFDKLFSPYERLLEVSVDGFAARYAKPIQNITDIDTLLYVLETAISVGRKETYKNTTQLLTVLGASIFKMLYEASSNCVYTYGFSGSIQKEALKLLNCLLAAFQGCQYTDKCNDFLFKNSDDVSSEHLIKPLQPSIYSNWLVFSMLLTICAFLVLGLVCEHYRRKKQRNSLRMYNLERTPYFRYLPHPFHQQNHFWNYEDSESTYLMVPTKSKPKHYKKFTINMSPKKSQFKNTRIKKKFSYFVSIPEEEEHDYRKSVN